MHLAHFTNSYLPVVNGVVRSISAFRKALTALGHNVFIFAQQQNGYEDDDAFIFRYPSLPLPLSVDIPAVIPLSPFMDRLLPRLKLDVIHTHHPVLLGQAAANKADELDLPLVFTFHTQYREYTHYVPFPQEAVQEFLKDTIHNWLQDYFRRCHHIVIPSESMRNILVDEYGLLGPYTIIPTGIELEPYQSADGNSIRQEYGWESDRVMISIGRLAKEKNWELLLRATALSREAHPDLRLILLGDGPERRELEDLAAQLGIRERVAFIGEVPFEEVPTYLKAADFFAFASTTETQGLVTMEALAAHLPVIAVEASGTRDIVQHEKQGLLVANDHHALASGFDQLLSDEQLYQRFRNATQPRAQKFEIKALASNLTDVYRQAIQDKAQGHFVQVA